MALNQQYLILVPSQLPSYLLALFISHQVDPYRDAHIYIKHAHPLHVESYKMTLLGTNCFLSMTLNGHIISLIQVFSHFASHTILALTFYFYYIPVKLISR